MMKPRETRQEFLSRLGIDPSDSGQFNVYRIEEFCDSMPPGRRDFYKIALLTEGEGMFSYADKTIHVKRNHLSFSNPMIPYSWQRLTDRITGYFCVFTEDFVNDQLKADSLANSPLFKVNGNHVLYPDQKSIAFLVGTFEQMLKEIQSPYAHKYQLLRSHVQILMHESLKIEPPIDFYQSGTSSARISDLFLQLLERQFPVTSPRHTVRFKNPGEFADQLSVHTNHLNRALKEATGKTTSQHIAERLLMEAKALLLHTNWDIAEIGHCLSFEHASNFNIFFKKQAGQTPNHFRRQTVVIS